MAATSESPKITVQGEGIFYRQPERAVLRLNVCVESTKAEQASSLCIETSNSLSAAFKQLCVKDNGVLRPDSAITHWSSGSLSKYSWIPWTNGKKEKDPKHRVSVSFEVKFKDFAKLSECVSEFSTNPHITVSSIDWRLTEEAKEKLQTAVRTMAVKDALAKAKDYAVALGFKDVKVASLVDGPAMSHHGGSGFGGALMRARAPGGGGGDSEFEFTPQDVELKASVHCEFVAI